MRYAVRFPNVAFPNAASSLAVLAFTEMPLSGDVPLKK